MAAQSTDHARKRREAGTLDPWPGYRWFLILSVLLVVPLGFIAGVVAAPHLRLPFVSQPAISDAAPLDVHLIDEALSAIQHAYVDRAAVQPKALTYGAIGGLVDALGDTDHSRFLTPQAAQQEQAALQGQLNGVGIEIQPKNGQFVVVAPLDNSPAQRAGVRPGDRIVGVGGKDVTELSLEQLTSLIRGPVGTKVTLTLVDPGGAQPRTVTLTRTRIQLNNVTWHQIPGTTVAHLRIATFSRGVAKDLQSALQAVEQQHLSGVVLDLRSNPGGLLDEAVGTASQFLRSGNVVLERDAQGHVTPVPMRPGGVATDLPLVVMVDAGTASAAEIVAGALHDAHRAPLVGETTFGTGTVLNTFPLSDGSQLLLATQEWLTPAGHSIWHHGITPDHVLALSKDATPLVPETEATMTAAQIKASNDTQLLQALALLAGAQP